MGDWIPPSTFLNRSAQVDTLNKLIKELTEGAGLAYPALHMYGMKYFKSGTKQHKFDSKNGSARIWRETEVRKKLHFTKEVKLKIVTHILRIFAHNRQARPAPSFSSLINLFRVSTCAALFTNVLGGR